MNYLFYTVKSKSFIDFMLMCAARTPKADECPSCEGEYWREVTYRKCGPWASGKRTPTRYHWGIIRAWRHRLSHDLDMSFKACQSMVMTSKINQLQTLKLYHLILLYIFCTFSENMRQSLNALIKHRVYSKMPVTIVLGLVPRKPENSISGIYRYELSSYREKSS